MVRIHPHARTRMEERGVTEDEVLAAVEGGVQFAAKFGRTGFRRNFPAVRPWRGKQYKMKQVEVYAVKEEGGWLVITVVARFF